MSPQIGVVHHTGHFVYVIAVHSKSACSPNFEGFPWGMQVIWSLSSSTEVSCQVCSLQFGSWINSQYGVEYRLPRNSTVGLTDFQPTVGWQVPSSKKSQNIVHTFPSSQVVNTKSRLVSGLARNPLVILTIFLFFNIFCIPLSSIRFLSFYLIAANRCCSASLQLF